MANHKEYIYEFRGINTGDWFAVRVKRVRWVSWFLNLFEQTAGIERSSIGPAEAVEKLIKIQRM